jgi:protein-tyrosine phosphatase
MAEPFEEPPTFQEYVRSLPKGTIAIESVDDLYRDLGSSVITAWDEWVQVTEIEPGIYLGGIPCPVDDGTHYKAFFHNRTGLGDPSSPGFEITHFPYFNFNTKEAPHNLIRLYNIQSLLSFSDQPVKWNIKEHIHPDLKGSRVQDYNHYFLADDPSTLMLDLFDKFHDQISRAKKEGKNILIHCHAGISRSTTALAAYYLKEGFEHNRHPTVREVLMYIKSRRQFIRPNISFIAQLVTYRMYLLHLRNEGTKEDEGEKESKVTK